MLRFTRIFVAMIALTVSWNTCFSQTKGYDVTSYNATITLDRVKSMINGQVEMLGNSMGELSTILQHAKNLQIDSVFVDGVRSKIVPIDSVSGAYHVTGFPKYSTDAAFSLRTYYHGKATNEGGTNPWGGVTNSGGMMFAMGVGFSAPYISCTRHWMPCYDEPDDKADSVTLRFFADTSGIVVSNGLQTAYLLQKDKRTTFTEWKISHPIATYLLTFAFGPFEKLAIKNPLNIPFDVYCFAKDTAKVHTLMQKRVIEGLVFFDSLFGKYPFEKVGYVVAPIGSMEHQTMITLVNLAFDTNNTTAIHELSHMWWGDWITCYDFNDPWLNEGFAVFSESLFLERFFGKSQYWSKQHSNIAASTTATNSLIPLYGAPFHTVPRNNYPPVIYSKGASVLGMLRYFFGDSVFFAALRRYSTVNAYANSTSLELQDAFEAQTHKDLGWFFEKWVFGIGNPLLGAVWSRNQKDVTVRLIQSQDSTKIGYFRLPLVVEARTLTGKSERHEIQMDSAHITEVTFANSFIPDSLVIDPDGAVIKKMVGTVKLGVNSNYDQPAVINEMYNLRFNPNPSNGGSINLTISSLQYVHDALLDEDTYRIRRLIELTNSHPELILFDSNGNSILTDHLLERNMETSGRRAEYSYTLQGKSLPSGTYFATLLLNGTTIGARANLVIVN